MTISFFIELGSFPVSEKKEKWKERLKRGFEREMEEKERKMI